MRQKSARFGFLHASAVWRVFTEGRRGAVGAGRGRDFRGMFVSQSGRWTVPLFTFIVWRIRKVRIFLRRAKLVWFAGLALVGSGDGWAGQFEKFLADFDRTIIGNWGIFNLPRLCRLMFPSFTKVKTWWIFCRLLNVDNDQGEPYKVESIVKFHKHELVITY